MPILTTQPVTSVPATPPGAAVSLLLSRLPSSTTAALTLPTAPVAPRNPERTFSDDQYESFTYQKWFARHTGLSLDEALTLGLATREHAIRWKATRSPDGLWHLSQASPA